MIKLNSQRPLILVGVIFFSMSDVDSCVFFVSQWTISELACYTYSMVAVPLYDTLGTEAIGYIIDKGTQTCTFKTQTAHRLQCYRSTLDQGH